MMILKNEPRPYFNCQYSVSRSVSSAVGVKELSYNCTVFTDFQHSTLSPFQTFSLSYCIWAINEISCCMSSSVGGFIVGCISCIMGCISSSMILCCCMNWGVGGFIVGCISCIVGCISSSMILCCWMNWGAGGCIVGCMNDSFGGCFGGCMGVSLVGVGVFFRHLLRRFWNQNWD